MYTRLLKVPQGPAFLFGPRGTGKSTWIKQQFADAVFYDLLDTAESQRLSRDPGALYREVLSQPPDRWVVIDEVQRAPAVLNEVHRLIESRGVRFLLSGSSARKLRRGEANLLAGRAVTLAMYPLVSSELPFELPLERALGYGTLPMSIDAADPVPYLRSYAETYLDQEVRAEALTRNFGGFSRFLEIAARHNGQTTNATSIARDAGIGRSTVQTHFEILVDTLIGCWLTPWRLRTATKQVQNSKFYLFDCGVARALSGRLPYPPSEEEKGPLIETLLLGEIRAWLEYSGLHYGLHFWRTYDGAEVDFLCETTDGLVAIEVKAARQWQNRFNRGLRRLMEHTGRRRVHAYGVYTGDRSAQWGDVQVLPVLDFLSRMWLGEIIR